jgi:3-oxoacyl-[acyl-carrier protein] reductase
VCGASKGLGKACALKLAQEGSNVALCARGADGLKKATEEIESTAKAKVLPFQADLSKMEDVRMVVREAISAFGTIDILVANSGGPPAGNFFQFGEKDWKDAFYSVFYYVVELYREIIPTMKKNGWGRIINIVSLTVKEPSEILVLSNVFRSGVVSLSKTLCKELIQNNITINNVCPGAFKTDRAIQLMREQSKRTGMDILEIEKKAVEVLPMKRYQLPAELAGYVAFLASELATGITGTTVQIDGGIYKGIL